MVEHFEDIKLEEASPEELVGLLLRFGKVITQSQTEIADAIKAATAISEVLASEHQIVMSVPGVVAQAVSALVPVSVVEALRDQPEGNEVEVATTPIPASLGQNAAAGRQEEEGVSSDQMSEEEWEREIARRGVPQDARQAEAIHKESRLDVAAAASEAQAFPASIGNNYDRAVAAGFGTADKLQKKGGGVQ